TKIKFAVPVDAKVVVKVFNTIGQEVAEAVNGSFSSGLYEVSFNASDLTSGVYFYTIDAKGFDGTSYSTVRKMILMK
ncbi:MAG: T9SS type A sorting domain-containing protein, partial [Ignavibacteriales bacterium]|nr:T9SS type A sorting domain-containing protein [Ignavibacteriales bacterium]